MLNKIVMAMLAATTVTACAHQTAVSRATPPAPPPIAVAPAAAPAPATPVAPVAAATCSADVQCASNQLCVEGACTAITTSLPACGLARVHFDFDRDVLHPDEYAVLQRAARCIEANRPAHVLITGNADERGTVEYNLALGQRRAAAVGKYLKGAGVPGDELQLVSYGKELPVCHEHDEACWRENRRAGIRADATPRDVTALIRADEGRERTGVAN